MDSSNQKVLEANLEVAKAKYMDLEASILAARDAFSKFRVHSVRFQLTDARDRWVEARKALVDAFPDALIEPDTYDGSKVRMVLHHIDRTQYAIMNSLECRKLVLDYLETVHGDASYWRAAQRAAKKVLDDAFPGLSDHVETLPPYRPEWGDRAEPLHVILYGMRYCDGLPGYFYEYER